MILNLEHKYNALSSNLEEGIFSLKELLSFGEKTILYFYPKDNTPGCTVENIDFSCLREDFNKKGINLIGVSKDSIQNHKKFIENHNLKIDLISDEDLFLHKELGVYGEKNNYGKIVLGVIRSTFLFDKNGNLLKEWRNVKAKNHALKILKEI